MPSPAEDLQGLLADAEGMPDDLNLYAAPAPKIEVPAVVIRPGEPWMEPSTFCFELERYSVICAVSASTPEDGIALLRALSLAIIGALVPPWDWESVEGPLIDDTTGVPFLANRVRLVYKNGGST